MAGRRLGCQGVKWLPGVGGSWGGRGQGLAGVGGGGLMVWLRGLVWGEGAEGRAGGFGE